MILNPLLRLNRIESSKWFVTLARSGVIGGSVRFLDRGKSACITVPRTVNILNAHTSTCPAAKKRCGSSGGGRPDEGDVQGKRRIYGGKCRMGFIPEEFFHFFHVKTGISGGYLFLLNFVNYCVSKEVLVMEHEYYCGLSITLILWYVSTYKGREIGAALDQEVDSYVAEWEKARIDEKAMNERLIKDAQLAAKQAEGQKLLMDAKKENVAMQLEAIYRERLMHVYKMVKGRMDYHLRRQQAEARIHQKWMYKWVMDNVMKSITPEFETAALNQAIKDIEGMASRA